jgi:hypothetical protein
MTDKEKKVSRNHDQEQATSAASGTAQSGESRRMRRRALLGAISAVGLTGAAPLPRHWARPVVDHILLPAHAQTSPALACTIDCTGTAEITFVTSATSTGTGIDVTLTQALTIACQREPDGETVSSSSSISTTFTDSETTVPTATSTTFGFSGSFTGTECELDLSDVLIDEMDEMGVMEM